MNYFRVRSNSELEKKMRGKVRKKIREFEKVISQPEEAIETKIKASSQKWEHLPYRVLHREFSGRKTPGLGKVLGSARKVVKFIPSLSKRLGAS